MAETIRGYSRIVGTGSYLPARELTMVTPEQIRDHLPAVDDPAVTPPERP